MADRLFEGRQRHGALRLRFAAVLALVLVFCVTGWMALRSHLSDALAVPTMRLHVIPNSDSAADQQLKLLVRDALLPAVDGLLAAEQSQGAAALLLAAHGDLLRDIAAAELDRLGADYSVAIETDVNDDGHPIALRIIIGAGRGANWFCVLVPPLCFADLEPVERVPVTDDDPVDEGSLRIAWKWLGPLLDGLGFPIEGVGDVDQDDVHPDLANAVPRDGDVRPTAE